MVNSAFFNVICFIRSIYTPPPDRFDVIVHRVHCKLTADFTNMFHNGITVSVALQSPYGFVNPLSVEYLPGTGGKQLHNVKLFFL